MARITTEEAFGRTIAPTRGAVGAFAFIVVVVGMMVASALITLGGGRVKLAEGGSCGVTQHVAASALDETWAVACDDEFGLFTEHVDALLCGSFYDGVSGVNYRYQNGAKRDTKDVCGILLPVRRHPK